MTLCILRGWYIYRVVRTNARYLLCHIEGYEMIVIYCNWVSTRWQEFVDLYENRQETAQNEKQCTKHHKTTKNHRIHKIKKMKSYQTYKEY